MAQAYIALIGGPLDGVYIPMLPPYTAPASGACVWSPPTNSWIIYELENSGGVASMDCYKLKAISASCLVLPEGASACRMLYQRPANKSEIAQVERNARRQGGSQI